jgi:hypothetical protein
MPTTRTLARLSITLALIALALFLLGVVWLLDERPAGASCYDSDGFNAIQAHAGVVERIGIFALIASGCGGVLCIIGAAAVAGRRLRFAAGVLPFAALALASGALTVYAGFYCMN